MCLDVFNGSHTRTREDGYTYSQTSKSDLEVPQGVTYGGGFPNSL